MGGFNQAMAQQIAAAKLQIQQFMSEATAMMQTTITPTIRPRLDMSAVSGVHADTGVE
jgi:hypothetical protein